MIHLVKSVLTGQFEAALAMLRDCIRTCPPEHWDGIIGKYPFWHVAYHALCFLDLYLTQDEATFALRPIHPAGWAEFNDEYPSRRFEQRELAEYVEICRNKGVAALAAETSESLAGRSGFARLGFTRLELHLYNIRHVQHHAGQLSAYLRRVDAALQDPATLRWVRTGWPAGNAATGK